jgi:DNA-binding CsgD family transcriptional regulator
MEHDRASGGELAGIDSPGSLSALTPRELEVLALLSGGASTKSIAAQLGISPSTVKRHLTNLYRKLAAANRVDAVREYLLADERWEPARIDRPV